MNEIAFAAALFALQPLPFGPAEVERSAAITEPELRAHVHRLASPAFAGRRGPGAKRCADYLAFLFAHAGLKPAFGDSYLQPIPWLVGPPGEIAGRNVGAMIPGSDPALANEWVLLSAHYDHLGTRGDRLYPGADDNASGVAMLLEVAEALALAGPKPRRTVLFVAFDLEEVGLQGSTHFAAHPPRPLRDLKAFLTADLLGRSMANLMTEYVYVLGSETAPELRALVESEPPAAPWKTARMGTDLVGTRSDYGPFRDRRVPFLFFTTGTHPDYHRPTDLPDRLDYAKLAGASRWIERIVRRLATDAAAPQWNPTPPREDLAEAQGVLLLLERAVDRPTALPLGNAQRERVTQARDRLREIVARGRITAEERQWLVTTTRLLLSSVF